MIEHNPDLLSTYFFLLIPSNCRIDLMGHHQRRMYHKSDVTFVCI